MRPLLVRLQRAGLELEEAAARRQQWERLFAPDGLMVPWGVRLADGEEDGEPYVVWQWVDEAACAADALAFLEPEHGWAEQDDRGILNAFVRLADAVKPQAFLRFARRYGPLELCAEHGLPVSHTAGDREIERDAPLGACGPWRFVLAHGRGGAGAEYDGVPVALWREYARDVRAVLGAAAALHRGEPISGEDWPTFAAAYWRARRGKEPPADPPAWRGDVEQEREHVGMLLDLWIERAGVRPRYTWTGALPNIGLGGGGVFGAVIRQLAFSVAKVRGVAVCAGCGAPFVPQKRWKFCPECGKRAADREAQRRRRARLRGEA